MSRGYNPCANCTEYCETCLYQKRIEYTDRLHADLDAREATIDALRAELKTVTAERDAAVADIKDMLCEAVLLIDDGMCHWCECCERGTCFASDCQTDSKWRGAKA